MCGCLHISTTFIKCGATEVTSEWDDEITDAPPNNRIMDVITRELQDDPVRGKWCDNGHEFEVWVDTGPFVTGVSLEINGDVVEDACWLRPEKNV